MLTAKDLAERWKLHVKSIYRMRTKGVIPAPLLLGDCGLRWREPDILAIEAWWLARSEFQASGRDPNGPDGPAPPVLSDGYLLFDPRTHAAQQAEARRREASAARRAARAETEKTGA